jgi:hypothetical protein
MYVSIGFMFVCMYMYFVFKCGYIRPLRHSRAPTIPGYFVGPILSTLVRTSAAGPQVQVLDFVYISLSEFSKSSSDTRRTCTDEVIQFQLHNILYSLYKQAHTSPNVKSTVKAKYYAAILSRVLTV